MRLRPHGSRWFLALTIAAAAVVDSRIVVRCTNAPRRAEQEALDQRQGQSSGRICAAARRRDRRAQGRRERLRGFLLRLRRVGLGRRHQVREQGRLRSVRARQDRKSSAATCMEHTFRSFTSGISPMIRRAQSPACSTASSSRLKQKNKTVGSGQTTVEIRQRYRRPLGWQASVNRPAAVDHQHVADDHVGHVARQEQHRADEIVRLIPAADRAASASSPIPCSRDARGSPCASPSR